MNRILFLCAGLALGASAATPALAAGPLEIQSSVLVETRQRAADGSTAVRLLPARRIVPGDQLVYVLSYRNTGATPLADIVLANPLPRDLAYRSPAEGSPAPELSVDGAVFGPLAALRVQAADGSARPAAAADVTHIRWRLVRPLAAGERGQVSFKAVLK